MALAQQSAHLLFDLRDHFRRSRLHINGAHHLAAEPAASQHSLLRGRKGYEDDVVLIMTHGRLSFSSENTEHLEWYPLDANHLPYRVFSRKQALNHRFTQQCNLCRALHLFRREGATGGDLPLAHFEVFRRNTIDESRPVEVAEHHLTATSARGRDGLHAGNLVLDSNSVIFRDSRARAPSEAYTARRACPGQYDDEVRAQAAYQLG